MAYHISKNPIKRLRDYYNSRIKWRKYDLGAFFHAGRGVRLWAPNHIKIGKYCYLGRGSQIECDIEMGDYVFTGNNVAFAGRYDHNWEEVGKPMLFSQRIKDADYRWKGLGVKTIVEDDVWVGYGSIILSGITIGKGSIIAAGSVLTTSVEPYSIYGGVPAKKLGERFSSDATIKKHEEEYNTNWK